MITTSAWYSQVDHIFYVEGFNRGTKYEIIQPNNQWVNILTNLEWYGHPLGLAVIGVGICYSMVWQ